MTWLTDAELAQLRADLLDTLPGTATITRHAAGTADAYGDVAPGAGTSWTARCRLDPYYTRQDTAGMLAGREQTTNYYTLTLPWDTSIADGDAVTVGGEAFEILQLHDVHSANATRRATLGKVG